ncbi:MAG: NAD(+)/NADH kinase [Deltaproteobacteria bacterium]|nr:NAD(+)/NADH kinase [Deltaproteobacteria bacterium]MBW1873900.1 NAD(+)/NADH kinase [Deltaproteobacteria bacterium]MBW2210110.1 NAD(+)/NADH kinase [Deltaproteobacteria bacterium]MBW2214436.1 NAD(+)/NADH kinase [Deltaproteobacteria bacterium]MBW2549206.1 NAD(+)/NADH kinase [Deltaproteobacteria bacterium]
MRPRVLVVYKKSTYQRYVGRAQERLKELIEHSDVSVEGLLHEHEIHQETLRRAKAALRSLGARAVLRYRPEPLPEEGAWDLIVTLGGDGTLLWASHLADSSTPMLAINSAPDTSVGYFCAADGHNVDEVLAAALEGSLKSSRLARMRVDVGDTVISTRVLNDALYCHESPAATSRYILEYAGDHERQMSSGVWVGPAAGSTAAIRSAGGKVLPTGSQKIQFVVREPYRGVDNKYRLVKGMVPPGEDIRIASRMTKGRIFLDGTQKVYSIGIGDRIRMTLSSEPLTLLGLGRRSNRSTKPDALK